MSELDELEALRRAFSAPTRSAGYGNYYPFFLMDNNQEAVVRFLPDKNPSNPLRYLVEKLDHRLVINGETKTTPCLSQYGEDCPICQTAQRYYKLEGDDSENGRAYYKKRKYIGQILVVKDPLPVKEGEESNVGKLMHITIGFQIFNVMKNAIDRGFVKALPYNYKNGYDFVIVKSPQGKFSTYSLGSAFAPDPRPLDDDTIAYVEENIVDLSTLIPENPGIEKTEALLQAALTGESLVEEEANDAHVSPAVPPVRQQTVAPSTPVPTAPSNDFDDDVPLDKGNVSETPTVTTKSSSLLDDDDGEEDAEDILAQIKARRKSKTS